VANTASVYGAYLKHIKKTASADLKIRPADLRLLRLGIRYIKGDANELVKTIKGDILYLDPPYNARQYGSNYHMLNTISTYENFST